MHNMCVWAAKRKTRRRERSFYDEIGRKWDLGSSSEIIVSLVDFNGHKCAEGFEGVHGGMVLGKEMQKEEDCRSFVIKESYAWQTLGLTT